jgi:hypothetical protein
LGISEDAEEIDQVIVNVIINVHLGGRLGEQEVRRAPKNLNVNVMFRDQREDALEQKVFPPIPSEY